MEGKLCVWMLKMRFVLSVPEAAHNAAWDFPSLLKPLSHVPDWAGIREIDTGVYSSGDARFIVVGIFEVDGPAIHNNLPTNCHELTKYLRESEAMKKIMATYVRSFHGKGVSAEIHVMDLWAPHFEPVRLDHKLLITPEVRNMATKGKIM